MVNFEEGLTVKDFKTRPLPMLLADTAMYAPSHRSKPGMLYLRCILSSRRMQLRIMRRCGADLKLHRGFSMSPNGL